MRPFAFVFVLALFAAAALPVNAADSVDALLARSRAAMGGDALERVHGLYLTGAVDAVGVKGTIRQWFDLSAGTYAESQALGPLSGADGFDGRDAWVQDASGIVHVDAGEQGRFLAIDQAYVASNRLWQPGHGGATLSLAGQQQDAGKQYDVLRVAPPDSAPFDLWFDAQTALPARAVAVIGPATITTTFSDYRPVAGMQVPYQQKNVDGDGNASVTSVREVVANPPGLAEHVLKPQSSAHDFSIAGGATEASVPIELLNNHVYLNVMLNGKGPYRFIFDTGGLNVVDPAVAKEIGTAGVGSAQGSGVGDQTETSQFADVRSLEIGAVKITGQTFFVIPTHAGFGLAEGGTVDGLIGFEVLARFLTTFDYAGHHVTFRMPGTQLPAELGAPFPFAFEGETPMIAGAIDGVPAPMTVDTGARDSISIYGPFAKAHPQIVPATLTADGITGFGVGGPARGRLGRLRSLAVGPYTVTDLVADFSSQTKGAFANPYVAANIGGGVWKRFTVTFDYPNQTLRLVPNAAFASRDVNDRSGLFFITKAGALTVVDVRPGTPAAAAGIRKGDVVDAIDGKPAASLPIADVRALLMSAPGTKVTFTLTSGGATREAVVTLADYV